MNHQNICLSGIDKFIVCIGAGNCFLYKLAIEKIKLVFRKIKNFAFYFPSPTTHTKQKLFFSSYFF
jgi:hypothetical protein